ncbi:MAG: NAD-dependent epimerase/dehydratase family protein [Devosia sp.]
MKIFVTGTAGFIGFHLARRLLADGHEIVGYDALTDYYDVRLKRARHAMLETSPNFRPVIGRLENVDLLQTTISEFAPEIVLHFAAQAGVRYSIEHPETYMASNLDGTFNLLEALRANPPRHALLASTSSVYGANPGTAFRETERTDFPLSIYAATKRGTEALAHSYAHLFGIPTTMLRFFTVYGPWGRPDMAPLKFATAIARGTPIDIYGGGNMSRDFTFIDDVVEAVTRLITAVPVQGHAASPADSLSPAAPWRAVNVAGGQPLPLMDFVAAFEAGLGKPALRNFLPMQPGDVAATRADTTLLRALIGYVPQTPVGDGVKAFVDWFRTQT